MSGREKVLIVDDRPENLLALRGVLSDLDVTLIEAGSGNDALAASLHHDFALAILDIVMPGMDGYELAELLRGDPRTRCLPIIFLTAAASDEAEVFRGYDTGAVDYIVKPYTPRTLLAKTRVFLELARKTTELAEKVRDLAASEERYRSLVMTVPDIVYRIDREGRFTFLNDAISTLGYSAEQLIGHHFSEIMVPADAAGASRDIVLPAFAGKTTGTPSSPGLIDERRSGSRRTSGLEVQMLKRQGGERVGEILSVGEDRICVEVSSSGLYSGSMGGERTVFLGSVGIIRDISERKAMTDFLALAKDQAEAANAAKSTFVSNMSHEIRTPLNAIVGYTHLFRKADPTAEQAGWLDKIDAAAKHLLTVINDILDFSKIEAGKIELEQADFVLSGVLDYVCSLVGEMARLKGLAVTVDYGDVPIRLKGDQTRLRQALLNYLSNAVKFTDRGSVAVRARVEQDMGERIMVRFEVADTGIGISADKMAGLFEPFHQADSATTRRFGGTGLGLAITRRLVELMGGKAGADSIPGEGSTFWFTAVLGRGGDASDIDGADSVALPELDTEMQLRDRFAGARLLLAEDDPINRDVARDLLMHTGLRLDFAEDGRKAVERAMSASYDLILMDMSMPELDGLSATAKIRELPGYGEVPILAMTANAFSEDRARCLAAGMNDFIAKPVEPNALFACLLKWLSLRSGNRSETGGAPVSGKGDGVESILGGIAGLDIGMGLRMIRGNVPSYVRIIGKFARSYRDEAGKVREKLRTGDPAEARRLVHALKGASATMGAVDVQAHAARLERAIVDGLPDGDVEALVAVLERDLSALCGAIAAALPDVATPAETPVK